MNSISILDCTLRDGGFINDWNFGFGTIKSIISRLDNAGIEMVEIGFIDAARPADVNRSIQPNTSSFKPALNKLSLTQTKIVAMIDYGTCPIENIQEKSETNIDIIRVIFKKKDFENALLFCDAIQKKGYKVSVQPVSITSYTTKELEYLLPKINAIKPHVVSIVDTYGLMHNDELINYFNTFDKYLHPEILIGYHSHNNFQMAYSNCISLMHLPSSRNLIIDGSLYGMGKGAGNGNTELLAQYLNENYHKNYSVNQLLEAIDIDILKEYEKSKWGYSIKFFISASHDCHPNYVKFLMDKKTLSIKSINDILEKIPADNKLSFKKELIENLYKNYEEKEIEDTLSYKQLSEHITEKNILILAPGKTIETHSQHIENYITEKKPIIFSINFLHEKYHEDYVFIGNPKRYSQFFHKIYGDTSHVKVICTSNITPSNQTIDLIFNFNDLKSDNEYIRDNPMILLLHILSKINVGEIAIAGFDGYTPNTQHNYYGEYIQFLYCADDVLLRNEAIQHELKQLPNKKNIHFLTPSLYQQS